MSENRQLAKNLLWSLIATTLSYIVSFILTPYITKTLGMDAYGFITLSTTCTSYIDVITVALSAFVTRYIAIEYHNGRLEKAQSYFHSVFVAYMVLLSIMSILVIIAVVNIDSLLYVPDELLADVKILFLMVYVNYCINILGSLFNSLIFIKNKVDISSRNKGMSTILYAFLIIGAMLSIGLKVYSIAIAHMCSAILYFIANVYSSKKVMPEMIINIKLYSRSSLFDVISSGIWNSLNNIGAILNNGLDLVVTNRMLNNTIMGQVSVGKQLSNIFNAISQMVCQVFQPKQLEYYSKGDTDNLIDSLVKSIKTSGLIGCTIYGSYVLVGKQFLQLWIGDNYEYIYLLGLIALGGDIMQISNRPLFYVFTLTNKLKINCWITLLTGLLNFSFMFVLLIITEWGGYVVVGSTVVAYVLTIWCISLQAKRYLKLRRNPFNHFIIKNYIVTLILIGVGLLFSKCIIVKGWISLILFAVLSGIVTFSICLIIILNKNERNILFNRILTNLRKMKGMTND